MGSAIVEWYTLHPEINSFIPEVYVGNVESVNLQYNSVIDISNISGGIALIRIPVDVTDDLTLDPGNELLPSGMRPLIVPKMTKFYATIYRYKGPRNYSIFAFFSCIFLRIQSKSTWHYQYNISNGSTKNYGK